MGKISKAVLAMILIIFIIIGVIFIIDKKNEKKESIVSKNNIEYNILEVHSINDESNKIISNYEDFNNYLKSEDFWYNEEHKSVLKKYDKQYFKNKSLAIAILSTGSGSNSFHINKIEIIDNEVDINYSILSYGLDGYYGTCDMKYEIVVIEIDKNINEINKVFVNESVSSNEKL